MTYKTIKIGDLLEDVNLRYFLPAIQRPYVWSADQVSALIDSLMKGYPISSCMFWAIDDAQKQELRIYEFLAHWRLDRQNPIASVDGREITLVLDGQQRITSLLIALRGTYAEKQKHKRRNNPDAWEEKTLYLDLLKDPLELEDEDEVELGISYGLRFHKHKPRNDVRHHWFRIGEMLNYKTEDQLQALIARTLEELHRGVTAFERELVETSLRRLHEGSVSKVVEIVRQRSPSVLICA